jgi:membrane-associated two-gene conflict system component 1 (EACC1)
LGYVQEVFGLSRRWKSVRRRGLFRPAVLLLDDRIVLDPTRDGYVGPVVDSTGVETLYPDAIVTVSGGDSDSFTGNVDPARSLRSWLVDTSELRGRVRMVESPPRPGELGAWAEAVAVALGPGGAAAVLAGAVVSWSRWHRSDLRVTLRRKDGEEAEVQVKRLRGLDAAALPAVIDALQRWLDSDTPPGGSDAAELESASDGAVQAAADGRHDGKDR